MSTPDQRLKQARERLGIKSAKEAAETFGWAVSSYVQHENGTRGYKRDRAVAYARRYRTTPEWLLFGTGAEISPSQRSDDAQRIPLVSWVSAGQLLEHSEEIEPEDGNFTVLSGLPHSRYFATRVQGDSMDRYSPDGSVIIVDANDTDPRPGKSYIFAVRGEATYKIYQTGPERLEPWSTNPNNRTIFPDTGNGLTVVGRVVRTFLDLP